MNRIYQTLFLSLLLPLGVLAQENTNTQTSFDLDECIKYALEHTVEVQNARVDELIAEAKVKETIGIGLPQIDGNISLTHNEKLPRFFATYAVAQGFAEQDLNLGLADDDIVASPNFFQLQSSGDANVRVDQLLFNGSYLVGLKASRTYKDLAYKTTAQTQIQTIENVTKAYYSVLISNERIALFESNITRVDSLLRTTRAMFENGFAEMIDVDRIQVSLNNLKSERLKFVNLQNLSVGLLKFQMNYPMEAPITVEGDLSELTVNENLFNEYNEGWNYTNRIEYQILDTQKRLQELDIKNRYAESYPVLKAFGTLGWMTQSPDIGGLFVTNTDLDNTDLIGPDKWYNYSMFGVSMSVPIFSGLQRSQRIQQAKLSLLKIQNEYSSLKQGIDLSIQQNTITYKNSLETLKSQEENMELAAKVARVTKIKYEQGVGTNLEVTEAESSLRESQVNYYDALYDAIVAKIDLDKAYAKIDPSKYVTDEKE